MSMDEQKYKRYGWEVTVVTENGYIKPQGNSVIFWNQGTTTVTIDRNKVLNPPDPTTGKEGVAYTWEGYPGEINIHTYSIVFGTAGINGSTPVNHLAVDIKMYQE